MNGWRVGIVGVFANGEAGDFGVVANGEADGTGGGFLLDVGFQNLAGADEFLRIESKLPL